jgi:formylglycine-generating enzyme required for sulfatase activity/MinD-like ATPase involved in chromosome partitioning or flagellar assembly
MSRSKTSHPGSVITFYSYKGGSGRTMALANVGCLLAERDDSPSVLMIDWDLEAPGLHHFFPKAVAGPGLLELMCALRDSQPASLPDDYELEVLLADFPLDRFVVGTGVPGLSLMRAGQFGDGYARRVNEFDWVGLFAQRSWLFTALALRLRQAFDYVLIDSRTGLCDTSGLCTMLMPEKLAIVFTPNEQSLSGVSDLVRRAVNYRRQSCDARPLVVFPLPSRIEDSEPDLKATWRHGGMSGQAPVQGYQPFFEGLLKQVYGLNSCSLDKYFYHVGLQHVPCYSYGERIAVLEDASQEDSRDLGTSYRQFLTRLLALPAPWVSMDSVKAAQQVRDSMVAAEACLPAEPEKAEVHVQDASAFYLEHRAEIADPGLFDLWRRVADAFVEGERKAYPERAVVYGRALQWVRECRGDDPSAMAEPCYLHALALSELVPPSPTAVDSDRLKVAMDAATLAQRVMRDVGEFHRLRNRVSELYADLQARDAASGMQAQTVSVGGDVVDSIVIVGHENRVITDASGVQVGQEGDGPETPFDPVAVRESFLGFLKAKYRYLDFRGMGMADRVSMQMALRDMYVPLRAKASPPERETLERLSRGSQPDADEAEMEAVKQETGERVEIPALLARHRHLVVLGDPGSGKTTLLRNLAVSLACGEGDELGLDGLLPVLVPISAYANRLAESTISVEAFIDEYFVQQANILGADALVAAEADAARVLYLFDGLDEARDAQQRARIVRGIDEFLIRQSKKGNRVLLTSRIVGYRHVRLAARDDLCECTLLDFDDEDIRQFTEKWSAAIESVVRGQGELAAREAVREHGELLAAIAHNPGVKALATNPLLLTILALMKRQGVTLPERRVELYEKYVHVLLREWNLLRGCGPGDRRDVDVVETVRILAPLALWMHRMNPGLGLVDEEAMRDQLVTILRERGRADPASEAQRFLGDVHDHANLLLERGPRQYGFIHLTFQEYLAGVAIAQRGARNLEPMIETVMSLVGEDPWQEVVRLAVAYLGIVQGREEAADDVLLALIACKGEHRAAARLLAGLSLQDAQPGGVSEGASDAVIEALRETMSDEDERDRQARVAVGRCLGRLGDPRFRTDFCCLPNEALLGFVEVPKGPFVFGSDPDGDGDARDNEKPFDGAFYLPTFYMARYTVTVAQFRAFVEGCPDFVPGDPDCLADDPNLPVTRVSWLEACAYAQWLDRMLRTDPRTPAEFALRLRAGWRVALPSEPEWEKAARGDDGRIYPWGTEFDTSLCNSEHRFRNRTAVGCFPGGASPVGCLDMAGNVWEWTRSRYDAYPHDASVEATPDPSSGAPRVLRGGSFVSSRDNLRCACRAGAPPGGRVRYFGFRVVLSPCSLKSEHSDL